MVYIDIDDGDACIFKMESHNHPSYIEPYQGAATGVGGIMRDVFTMGARPVALLNALRFGDPSHEKTKRLVKGVVSGTGAAALARMRGASGDIDPGKVVTAETGTMVKSVVATGKIEPITKVEIKSKANGIIERLYADVDQVVNQGDVLADLDKEQLRARVRELDFDLAPVPISSRSAKGLTVTKWPVKEVKRTDLALGG